MNGMIVLLLRWERGGLGKKSERGSELEVTGEAVKGWMWGEKKEKREREKFFWRYRGKVVFLHF